jgi:hypothetical protein
MAIELGWQTAAAGFVGLIIGINIGFAFGAWWHALRTEPADLYLLKDKQA